jgi:Ca2+-binding EF-hand superfamily protein
MVLEYLDRQRDQPDPELLKKLNWSPEDLRKFSDRWRAAKEQARKTPEKKEELDAALRALGLRSPDQKVNRLKDKDDSLRGMQESGGRLRPPESIREQFEAFRKAAGKLEKSP